MWADRSARSTRILYRLGCSALAGLLLFQLNGVGATGGTLGAAAHRTNVDLEFLHGSAQGVAVHSQLPGCLALIAAIFLENRHDKTLFEFANRFRVEDVAVVHLKDECFQLIFQCCLVFRTFYLINRYKAVSSKATFSGGDPVSRSLPGTAKAE